MVMNQNVSKTFTKNAMKLYFEQIQKRFLTRVLCGILHRQEQIKQYYQVSSFAKMYKTLL